MVEKIKQFSLIILLIEIIFSSDLYAQSFKEKLKQAVRQEYNNAKQRNNNRNQYQKNSYRYNNNSQQYQNNSKQYSNKDRQKDSNNTENKAKSQDEAVLTVFGFGKTKDEATKIALRSAIEQAFGAFVSSNTQLLNDSLISDEIATVSSGNIKHYEYISEQKYENGYSVSLKATVSINKLIHYAESKGSEIEFGGDAFAMNIAMYELNKENEVYVINHLYREISGQIPFIYDYEISTSTPKKNGENQWEVPITATVYANENTQKVYDLIFNTFNSISLSEEEWNRYNKMGIGRGSRLALTEKEDTNLSPFEGGTIPPNATYMNGKIITHKLFHFRNDDKIFEKFMKALNIEAKYQSIAFKILDNLKEYIINITSMNEFIADSYNLNKYCDSSMKINKYSDSFYRNANDDFSNYFIQHSGSIVTTINLSLIYNSLDEIKKIKNIRIEPTHKSFTELKYEQ